VIQMTRSLAIDHGEDKIRVNAVCPGDTFVDRWVERGDFSKHESIEAGLKAMGESFPLKRVGSVEEIARAVLFLASDDSSYMTGVALAVDGGNTAQ